MNADQITLVQRSFAQLAPNGEALAALFYRHLFELDPALQPLFQHDIALQGRKFMTMLVVVVRGLDALDRLLPDVENLGRRHVAYGVHAAHYQIVEQALLLAIKERLGEHGSPAVSAAWSATYQLLAETMQRAARDVTDDMLTDARPQYERYEERP